jgi:dTDP-glucose 4,6-dehydratase
MKRVVVTGGSGFIGSNFIRWLLADDPGVEIINYDLLTYAGNPANLADLDAEPRYRFIHGDVADREAVRELLKQGIDTIFHFAAESHVDRSILDATPFVRTNVLGTQVLLDAARELGVRRFIQISTDEVYGSLGPTGFFREDTPLAPNSPYSASKAGADMLVRSYVHTFGFPALITRCTNNYGPYQFPEKLLPLFISNLMNDRTVPVYGDGSNVRDWIYVTDHCAGIAAVWRKGKVGEVYNIGGECECTNLEMTHMLLKALGKPESLINYVPDRPGHDKRYAMDLTKIKTELGWKPQVSLTEGLRKTITWYQQNQGWVEKIRNKEYLSYYEQQYGKRK